MAQKGLWMFEEKGKYFTNMHTHITINPTFVNT